MSFVALILRDPLRCGCVVTRPTLEVLNMLMLLACCRVEHEGVWSMMLRSARHVVVACATVGVASFKILEYYIRYL